MALKYNVLIVVLFCHMAQIACASRQSFFAKCFGIFKRNKKRESASNASLQHSASSNNVTQQNMVFSKMAPDHKIRVLLVEKNESAEWHLSAPDGFMVTNGLLNKKKRFSQTTLKLGFKKQSLRIHDRLIKETCLKIDAQNGHMITFQDKQYQGSIIVMIKDSTCLVINELNFEKYVYCVLRSESWPGWPLEVNKAFAIASRSYAMVKYLENVKRNKPYHIKNSNLHQTYNGFHSNETLRKAVDETSGLILTYNKKPITAMFDCCCGDVIPAHLSTIDLEKAPYLARKVPCTFCKSSKIYQWQLEFDTQELKDILNASGFTIKMIHDMYVSKKDKAGIVEEITVKDHSGHHYITGKQFYGILSKVKSFCYSIRKRGKKIIIAGKGYGHHLGICQWGARNMINYGWNYQAILQFYYPGTTFMRLAYT